MMKNLDTLRGHNHFSKMLREQKSMIYSCEKYIIHASGTGKHAIITVFGNYDLMKVCISKEYMERKPGSQQAVSLRKTEEQFELSEMTAAFFDTLIVNLMKELLTSQ